MNPSYIPADQKIHISNLHESITEEILWNSFKEFGQISNIKVFRNRQTQKSRGYGKIIFQQPTQAAKSIKEMNFRQLIDSQTKQKPIRVSKDIPIEQIVALKKHNIHIKGIPADILDHRIIYNYLTKYGEIHSLSIVTNKGITKNSGFGFVQFVNQKDSENLIKKTENGEEIKFEGSKLEFYRYAVQEKKQAYNNFYIRDFSDATFEGSDEEMKPLLEKETEALRAKLSKYGKIASLIVQVDKTNKKPFSFCSFEEEGVQVQQLINDYNNKKLGDKIYINKVQQKASSKVLQSGNRFFNIKNLKYHETEEQRKEFEKQCRSVFETFGKVSSFKISVGQKPSDKQDLKNSCFAILVFEDEAKGSEFLMNYLQKREVATLFNDDNPHSNVTILLPKSERKRMIYQQTQNMKQNQQQAITQMTAQQLQQFQPQYNRAPFNGSYKPMNNQNRGPQQINKGRGGNMMQYNNLRQQKQQNPQPVASAQPQQQQPQQPQQPGQQPSLEYLKNNLEKFTTMEPQKQSQFLGNLIFPKVKELVQEQKQPDSLAPKITGMLIDFSVFDVSEIIDILENQEDLKERVNEAIELIKQQQQ